jgi:hypothetical protein
VVTRVARALAALLGAVATAVRGRAARAFDVAASADAAVRVAFFKGTSDMSGIPNPGRGARTLRGQPAWCTEDGGVLPSPPGAALFSHYRTFGAFHGGWPGVGDGSGVFDTSRPG